MTSPKRSSESATNRSGPSSTPPTDLEWFRGEFRPHFDRAVFDPIDGLVNTDYALVGFIMMACAIDYLASFWWGKSTKGATKKAYTGFIEEYFPKGRYDAEGLWDSLRNGLVHLFTIRGKKYALVHNQSLLHLQVDTRGHIILNADSFRDDLRTAKDKYFNEVESNPKLLVKLMERYNRDGFLYVGPVEISEIDFIHSRLKANVGSLVSGIRH